MKRQDLIKYHQQTIAELKKEVGKLQTELVEVKMKIQTRQLQNVKKIKSIRKDIAKIKTIIRHKQLVETGEQTAYNIKPLPKKAATEAKTKTTKSKTKKAENKE